MQVTGNMNDLTQSAAITRRQALEKERLARIQDPKYRTMGLPMQALKEQEAEKAAAKQADADREKFYEQQRLLIDTQLQYMEQQKQAAMRNMHKDLEGYRQAYQTKEMRREFDLSDPDALKKDRPAREADDDERLGPASVQKLHGEDLGHASRVKQQQQQMKEWCTQKMAESENKKLAEKQADAIWAARQFDVDDIRADMERKQAQLRTGSQIALAEYHLAQAAAKREKERGDQIADVQDSIEEIQNNLNSDMLCETPSVAQSYAQAHRVRPDHYKGISPMEKQSILAEQAMQREELAAQRAAEKAEKQMDEAMMTEFMRQGLMAEAEVQAKRAAMRQQLKAEQHIQAKEKDDRYNYLYKVAYTNPPTEEYFAQFGTSSR